MTGGCLCGRIRYRVLGVPLYAVRKTELNAPAGVPVGRTFHKPASAAIDDLQRQRRFQGVGALRADEDDCSERFRSCGIKDHEVRSSIPTSRSSYA